MKWIGQHIVDFIARFRSDVYLEDIADGTVADNKFLGLDSNNKIVKEAASATVTDLHTAGVDGSATQLLTDVGDGTINSEAYLTFSNNVSSAKMEFLSPADTGDKFQINTTTHGATTLTTIDDDATAAHFEIAANGNITLDAAGSIALEAGSGVVTGDAAAYQFSSSSTSRPSFSLDNNTDDATGPTIQLRNFRDGNGLEDGDILGNIVFDGHDVVGQDEGYGSIVASAIETGNGDEAGQIAISVANDGTPRNGITMTADKGTAEEVDVTIANGAASLTTIAGDLSAANGVVRIESHAILDAQIESTGHLNFVIDSDNDETGQSFGFFANTLHGSNKIMSLAEDATLQVGDFFSPGTVVIHNEVDDANSGELKFQTQRGAIVADAQDDDTVGKISFHGHDDGTPSVQQYGEVTCIASDVTSGQEAGAMIFKVAEFDGTVTQGLKLEGNTDANGEVDVNIAAGAASTTTIAGNLTVTTGVTLGGHLVNDIDVAGEFVDSDEHLMTSAAINDRIAAAGGGGGVTADPFSVTAIKILPHQFICNDDVGRPAMIEDDTSNTLGVRAASSAMEFYAFQKLPAGYKATHVQVHASASTASPAVTARSFNYQTGADNNVSETSGAFNANIDITDIPVSATQDLVIKITPASASTIIFGATVTIATI